MSVTDTSPVADVRRGLRWSTAGRFGQHGIQLLGLLVLARLLHPEDFGLLEMALPALGIVTLFRDLGTSSAIVQQPEISTTLLSSVFWLNIGVGVLGALALVAGSSVLAEFFREPRLRALLVAVSVVSLVSSVGLVPQAVLERAMQFARLAKIDTVAALASVAVAFAMAMAGLGVWSLVGQMLVRALITSAAMAKVSGWRPEWAFDWRELQAVSRYSLNLTGFGVVNYLARNADNIIIGRFLGTRDLGYYALAYRIMLYPVQMVGGVVGRVLFPALVRMRDDHAAVRRAYLAASGGVALLTFPILAGLWVVVQPATPLILGAPWAPLAPLLMILAPVGLSQCLATMTGVLYSAKGRTDLLFRVAVVVCSCFVASFLVGVRWGVLGVASAYAAAMALVLYPTLAIPFRLVGLRVVDLLGVTWRPLLNSMLLVGAVATVEAIVLPSTSIFTLGLLVGMGVVAYVGATYVNNRAQLEAMLSVLRER